jgi:hypothetical protein
MKPQIKKEVAPGIVQITLDPERWYAVEQEDGTEKYYPSATWILDQGYPKGYGFQRYLTTLGSWEQGQQILSAAGDRGSRVHAAIEQLLRHEPVNIFDVLPGHNEQISAAEWKFVMSFVDWYNLIRPTIISVESTVVSEEHGYAGTADLYCVINKELNPAYLLVDWKTSSQIYDTHKCQLAAYAVAARENGSQVDHILIVRLGSRHKIGYEVCDVIDVDHYFDLFLAAKKIWANEWGDTKPKHIEANFRRSSRC